MASITQTVPYYIQGISEQPDHLKKKGQVRDAINVIPDITDGLLKRPGGKHINEIQGTPYPHAAGTALLDLSLAEGAWFGIDDGDEDRRYIGRVHI